MPIYEYECLKCHKVEETLQNFSDKPLTKCKHCSGKLQKLISHNSFHLKGSGWYVTDYAKKSQSPAKDAKEPKKNSAPEPKNATSFTKKIIESAD
jgi:putative FmdB family regulatory protein